MYLKVTSQAEQWYQTYVWHARLGELPRILWYFGIHGGQEKLTSIRLVRGSA